MDGLGILRNRARGGETLQPYSVVRRKNFCLMPFRRYLNPRSAYNSRFLARFVGFGHWFSNFWGRA